MTVLAQEVERPPGVATLKHTRWICAVVVTFAAVAWLVASDDDRSERSVEIRGKITFLDAASRTGSLEFPDPQSGEAVEASALVAADALVTLNGRPAKLEELRPDYDVLVRAKIARSRTAAGKTRTITAFEVHASAPPADTPLAPPRPAETGE